MVERRDSFIVFWLIALLLSWPCLAQTQGYFRRLGLNDGLSQSSPSEVYQDKLGYIWMGTLDGLNRYDGYEIKVFRPDPDDPFAITGVKPTFITEDAQGNLWIGLHQGGVNRYDREHDQFHKCPRTKDLTQEDIIWSFTKSKDGSFLIGTEKGQILRFRPATASYELLPMLPNQTNLTGTVQTLLEEDDGTLWAGTLGGGLYVRLPFSPYFQPFQNQDGDSVTSDTVNAIYKDGHEDLWFGTKNGLFRLEARGHALVQYRHQPGSRTGLNAPEINDILEDEAGHFWVATNGGLSLMDRTKGTFVTFRHQPVNPNSLSDNRVSHLFEDRDHLLWVSTFGSGMNIFNPKSLAFNHLTSIEGDPNSLSDKLVWSICETPDGTLWIGLNGGGLNRINPGSDEVISYRHQEGQPMSLASDVVRVVFYDGQGNLWLGHQGAGLDRMNLATGAFEHFTQQPDQPNSLSDNWVLGIHRDPFDQLWVGTYLGGANLLNPDGKTFTRFQNRPKDPNSLSANRVWGMTSSSDGTLWFATIMGLNRYDQSTATFKNYLHDPDDPNSLTLNLVGSVYVDRRSQVWAGTPKGLNRMTGEGHFQHYRIKDGLRSEFIYGMLEDQQGQLWLSTNQGLARLDPDSGAIRCFVEEDGLQSNEFNSGAYFKNPKGKLYFGGVNGFNAFYPEEVATDYAEPQMVITDFLLQNKSIRTRMNSGSGPDWSAPDQMDAIRLGYEDYQLSFEFSALNFAKPLHNRYAYQLEGLDKEWIETDALRRYATFTRLAPGDYVFRVKGASEYGRWNSNTIAIKLTVEPAPWRTWWAYTIYAILLLGLIVAYLQAQEHKLNRQRAIAEQERRIAARLRQVDKLKDEFLANTSHELRTPLNGIIGLADSLADGVAGPLNEQTLVNLRMIVSSGKRLASLVDDILDFSKLRDRSLQLRKTSVDLHALTNVVLALSRPLLGGRPVVLINEIPPEIEPVWGDENRIQQIMHNLVGNAVKFTERGEIRVKAWACEGFLEVSVQDTGPGIPEQDHERIFESFEQVDGDATRTHGGTGLGLALTRQLVGLHGGTLMLSSALGVGSSFTFNLPIANQPAETTQLIQPDGSLGSAPCGPSAPANEPGSSATKILVVDDEQVNRQVIRNHLSSLPYEIWEAASGAEALELVAQHSFNAILLDIMMPHLSGYDVCRTLRETHSIHTLPILFLTARNQVSDLKLGFEVGANDYLTKPIEKDELLLRLKTHLELLDTNRNLEARVVERTIELQERKEELDTRNREILRTRDQLMFSEKMVSLGTLAAGIAHEIRNPLTFITGFAEVSQDLSEEIRKGLEQLRSSIDPKTLADLEESLQDLSQNSERIQEHGHRANQIVQNMIVLARGEKGESRLAKIHVLLHEFAQLAWQSALSRNDDLEAFKLEETYDESLSESQINPHSLTRMVLNLVNNAVEAMAERKEKEPETYNGVLKIWTQRTPESLLIGFHDNGIGIPESRITQVFTPFYTTKIDQKHLGLGLSLVYEIMTNEYRGSVEVSSEPGEQTEVVLRLPLIR